MNRPQVVVGAVLIVFGTVFLLDALDVVSAGQVIGGWWPMVIVAVGVSRLLGRPRDLLGGGVVTFIGLVLLGVTLDVLDGSVFTLAWPLAVIAVGLYLVASRLRPRVATDDLDSVSVLVAFSGRELAPTSRAFTGGSLVAVFGGIDLDLRRCQLAEGARLDVTVAFGGCDIQVPVGWRVRMHGPAIFGGTEDGSQGQALPPDAPTLDVRVLAAFGGVEVGLAPAPTAPAV